MAVFQNSKLQRPWWHNPMMILWGRVCSTVASDGLSQKTVTRWHNGSEFIVNHSTKPALMFTTLSLFLCWSVRLLNGTHWVFCPLRGCMTSTKYTPSRGTASLPMQPRGSSYHTACSRDSALLPCWSTTQLATHDPGNGTDLGNFKLCASLFILKNCDI